MILPEGHHASQQMRAAQDRTVQDSRSTDYDVAAAASRNLAAAVFEFLGSQPIAAGFFVEHRVSGFELVPIVGRRQIHFQHAWVGSDAERAQARVGRRSVALNPHWHFQVAACVFNRADEIKIVGEDRCKGEKHVQATSASLHAKRRPYQHVSRIRRARHSGERIG